MPRTRVRKIHPSKGARFRLSPAEILRLLSKVAVDENGCWIWSGYCDGNGYPQFKLRGSARWATRMSYLVFRGRLDAGKEIDHKCHNTSCINPSHLRQKSKSENSREGSTWQRSKVAAECAAPF